MNVNPRSLLIARLGDEDLPQIPEFDCGDHKLTLEKDEKTEHDLPRGSVPAIKVARIGRSITLKGMGFGEYLLDYVHLKAIELSETELGVRFLTLDAYPNRVTFYKSKGFQENLRQSRGSTTTSMRLDIFREAD